MTCKTFCQYAKDVGMIEHSCYNECLYSLKEMTMTVKFTKPTLITITAPTCAGKSTLLADLTHTFDICTRIISTTTRDARVGEMEGVDYFFISEERSKQMEANGEFAELITFRGTRYGVTHTEMAGKMNGEKPPVVILEPQGLTEYEKLCEKNGWDIFKVYVHTQESVRLKRLSCRTASEIIAARSDWNCGPNIQRILERHTDRVLSITEGERLWQTQRIWDVVVPGDDLHKAIDMIIYGINVKNKKDENIAKLGW